MDQAIEPFSGCWMATVELFRLMAMTIQIKGFAEDVEALCVWFRHAGSLQRRVKLQRVKLHRLGESNEQLMGIAQMNL